MSRPTPPPPPTVGGSAPPPPPTAAAPTAQQPAQHLPPVQTPIPQSSAAMRRTELDDDLAEVDLSAELDRFEEIYMKECMKSRPNPTAKFNYAWALIRSKERANIKKGVIMMQGLLEDRYADRDCLYYMALGYYRLDDVVSSRKCLDKLLKIAPNCRQAISLMDIVEDKITKDGVIGISIVSGIAVVGGLLAAAFAGGKR
ncbi:Mitochondria fission 1 protein [Gracilaria domingensis]|nr:Mitochondria fission 1 protein [Gracilaria domingensis]